MKLSHTQYNIIQYTTVKTLLVLKKCLIGYIEYKTTFERGRRVVNIIIGVCVYCVL